MGNDCGRISSSAVGGVQLCAVVQPLKSLRLTSLAVLPKRDNYRDKALNPSTP